MRVRMFIVRRLKRGNEHQRCLAALSRSLIFNGPPIAPAIRDILTISSRGNNAGDGRHELPDKHRALAAAQISGEG